MRIYTSYFANLKTLEENGLYAVSICSKVPSFFKGPNIESVAPSKSILYEYKNSAQTEADKEHYKQRYIDEVLYIYRFHPEYLIDLLAYFSSHHNNSDIAVLCYERPEDFCHRHIFAEWFNERIPNLNIEEYPIYTEPAKKKTKEKQLDIISNTLF